MTNAFRTGAGDSIGDSKTSSRDAAGDRSALGANAWTPQAQQEQRIAQAADRRRQEKAKPTLPELEIVSSTPSAKTTGDFGYAHQRVEATKLPALVLAGDKAVEAAFDSCDLDKNGAVSRTELEAALKNGKLKPENRAIISEMAQNYDTLATLYKGEKNDEKGITKVDLKENSERKLDSAYADSLQVGTERARMLEGAREKMTPKQFEEFSANIGKFEERWKNTPDELRSTYQQLQRVLQPSRLLSKEQSANLANDVLAQAADPSRINQSDYNTCTVAALEVRMYSRHPSQAARLVADTASTGQYVSAAGNVVRHDERTVSEYAEPDSVSRRSHASQIFQTTAVNLLYARETEGVLPNSFYSSFRAELGSRESLLDQKTGETYYGAPGITIFDRRRLEDVNNQIAGVKEPSFAIDASTARTPQELRQALDRLQQENNYPAVLSVNLLNFGNPVGPAFHMVAIEVPNADGTVRINDQGTLSGDKSQTLTDAKIYQSMRFPDTAWAPEQVSRTVHDLSSANTDKLKERKDEIALSLHMLQPRQLRAIAAEWEKQNGSSFRAHIAKIIGAQDAEMLRF